MSVHALGKPNTFIVTVYPPVYRLSIIFLNNRQPQIHGDGTVSAVGGKGDSHEHTQLRQIEYLIKVLLYRNTVFRPMSSGFETGVDPATY